MPKLKTNQAAAKRFTKTASGRIKHKKRGMRHNLEHRPKDVKRSLRQSGYLADVDQDNIAMLIPYA
jgi:large subunit ribosomal protein L35